MKRLNPPQFELLAQLSSMRVGSATAVAAFDFLVLGYTKAEAAGAAGISRQGLEAALRRFDVTLARARELVRLIPEEAA